ncbi:MAG: YeeE/YedE family protein [Paracoccaceae bacterium]
MFDTIADTTIAALIGLFGGMLIGIASRMGRFCTLGAIEDMLYQHNTVRMRMWLVGIGTAIIGTFSLMTLGLLDAQNTVYLSFGWNPISTILGGLLFGYGMALVGTCGFGALSRLGGGDLRSFVIVLVMGIAAYITLSGPLAQLRVTLLPIPVADGPVPPGIAHLLGNMTGLSPHAIGLAIGAMILAGALASRKFIARPKEVFWGAVVGLAVISGWAGTQWIRANGFSALPIESHTFSAPLGDTIIYTMTSSGNSINFGVGSVIGVVFGAFLATLFKKEFRWEACEDHRELRRQIAGATFMGVGAVLAFGCTIGQGISAFSVLAYGAPVALISIIAGAAFGLHQLIIGFSRVA